MVRTLEMIQIDPLTLEMKKLQTEWSKDTKLIRDTARNRMSPKYSVI